MEGPAEGLLPSAVDPAALAGLSPEAREELEALACILEPEELALAGPCARCRLGHAAAPGGPRPVHLLLHLPEGYPHAAAPVPELEVEGAAPAPPAAAQAALAALPGGFAPGDAVLYDWLDTARDLLQGWLLDPAEVERARRPPDRPPAVAAPAPAPAPRAEPAPTPPAPRPGHRFVTGPPFTEKKSTFQAHVAPLAAAGEVEGQMAALLANPKIARATHNVMAYRIVGEGGPTVQDHDDDGETAAGGRLLHLLQVVDARNVLVVVSRWYGGVKLGPARFTHINNAARQLLVELGHVARGSKKKR